MSALDYLKDWRIMIVVAVIIVLAILDVVHGLNLGIEFVGGTQIPITLTQSVNPLEMSSITQILDQRISKFGLSQVTVEPVGNSGIYVQIPSTAGREINSTIAIIKQQGVFQGIVNGREAINGSGILTGGITNPAPIVSGSNVSYQVDFVITQTAQTQFTKAAFGQANKPIYMFLDRPVDAVVLFNSSILTKEVGTRSVQITEMENALSFGNRTIPIEFINANASNWPSLYGFFASNRNRYNTVVLQQGTSNSVTENLTALNYSLQFVTAANMTPQFIQSNLSVLIDEWPGVGLLSAPTLSPSLTTGQSSGNAGYVITGESLISGSIQQKINDAQNKSQDITTILSGGALPVQVIVGEPITTPASLGTHFEVISAVALLLAILAVSITIVIRYKKLFLIAPIIMTTFAELFIIGSIMGLAATIDLSAVAGMIAVIGTGVDAQIIITDEVVAGQKDTTMQTRVGHAFYLIMRNAMLLSLAMLPLFFSALTTEIWFAGATIIGALLGAAITRPAYGAIVSKHYSSSSQS
jgi:preprotein translocase subunit SecD